MDSSRECEMIRVLRGGHNAVVICPLQIKSFKMSAVVRQNGSAECISSGQDEGIWSRSSSIFLCRNHMMTGESKRFDGREWKVLIRIQQHTRSLRRTRLVLANGLINLSRVRCGVDPGFLQIGRL